MLHSSTTIDISNPASGRLVIPGVHDGSCGIRRAPTPGGDGPTVAFRWARGARRPEQAVGTTVTLDGAPYRLANARRSEVTQGFYVALLTPVADEPTDRF
jgi:hypothetical protein